MLTRWMRTDLTESAAPAAARDLDHGERDESRPALGPALARGLVEMMPAAACVCDADGRIILFNAKAAALWGRAPAPGERYSGAVLLHRRDGAPLPHAEAAMAQALRDGASVRGRVVIVERPGGATVTVTANAVPVRDAAGQVIGAIETFDEISARDAAEELNAFLLKLSDALRPLSDAESIQSEAARLLGEELAASRTAYYQIEAEHYVIRADYACGVPSMAGRHLVASFGRDLLDRQRRGETVAVTDVGDVHSGAEQESLARMEVGAYMVVPLVKDGTFVAGLTVHARTPRPWTANDIRMAVETAERTWAAVERARAEEAMRTSEVRYRTVVEGTSALTWTCSPDGLQVEPQPEWMAFTGQSAEEMLGDGWRRVVHPDDAAEAAAKWQAAVARRIPFENAHRIRRRDGVWRWMRAVAAPVRDAHGEIAAWSGMNFDITAQKEAEQRLRESEDRFRVLADAAPVLIWVNDEHGNVTVNRAYRDFVGVESDADVKGYDWSRYVHPEDRDRYVGAYLDAMRERARFDAEFRFRRHDGAYRWMRSVAGPRQGDDGAFLGYVGATFDVHDQKAAADALRKSEARYRTLFESIDEGFCVVEVRFGNRVDYRVVEANPAFYKNTGFPEAILGRWLREAAPGLEEHWFETYGRIARTGEPERFEQESAALGRSFDVFAFRAGDPEEGRVAILFEDVTERKRQERHAELLLREVNHRAKNMLSLVQAIARQTAATGADEFVERFGRRVQALAANQDLLVRGDWKAVAIDDLVRAQLGAIEDARVAFSGPGLRVTAAAAQTVSMALHELATNATKYGALSGEAGHVVLTWDVTPGPADDVPLFVMSWLESGGPPVRAPARRGFGSTVIERMVQASFGGVAHLEFRPEGVVWRLACAADRVLDDAPRAHAPAPERRAPSQRPHVLVVEDEPLIAMEIAEALTEADIGVIGPASSSGEALALLAQGGVDAALLDVNLGTETSEPVAAALTRAGAPFCVVSGYAREQLPPAMRDALLVSKPLDIPALLRVVRHRLVGGKLDAASPNADYGEATMR